MTKIAPQVISPGIYPSMPGEIYHNPTGISKSGLDLLHKCPALYKRRYIDGIEDEPTPAMIIGSAVHSLVLEPDAADFVVAPECDRRTKEGDLCRIFAKTRRQADFNGRSLRTL